MTTAATLHLQAAMTWHADGWRIRAADAAVEVLLVVLLWFMPIAAGAVEPWSEGVVMLCVLAMALAAFAGRLGTAGAWRLSWPCVPAAGFVVLGLLQTRTSLYPHATWSGLRLVLAAMVVFVVVATVYRQREQVMRLLLAIALAGEVAAVMALGQRLGGIWLMDAGDYGVIPAAGPFMNYNHFAQFMNLSVGAGMAVLLLLVARGLRTARDRWLTGAVCAMVILGVVGVFVSLSRGGILSMAAAGACVAVVLARRSRGAGRASLLAAIALAAVAVLPLAGFDHIYDRLASLGDWSTADRGRLQILRDLVPLWCTYPLLGTGLGTFEAVFPLYDRSGELLLTTHAENEYAQVLAETGLVGLALVVGFAAMIAARCWRLMRRGDDWRGLAACGLGFGLLAVAMHSFSDFGQHVTANAMLSAIFCGLIVSMSAQGHEPARRSPALKHAAGGVLIAAMACAAVGASGAWLAENHSDRAMGIAAGLAEEDWRGGDDEYGRLVGAAGKACELAPQSAPYAYRLCEYRWRAVARARRNLNGRTRLDEAQVAAARQIVADLHRIRVLCPSYAAPLLLAGQIEFYALGDAAGADHIRQAYAMAPHDPPTCYAAGMLDVWQERWAGSLQKLARLSDMCFEDLAHMYIGCGQAGLAVQLAGDSVQRLSYVAAELLQDPRGADWADKALEAAIGACNRPGVSAASPSTLANVARLCLAAGRRDAGIDLYQRALAGDGRQVNWRMALARELAAAGQTDAALREARWCLRLRPQMRESQALIEGLSVGGRVN